MLWEKMELSKSDRQWNLSEHNEDFLTIQFHRINQLNPVSCFETVFPATIIPHSDCNKKITTNMMYIVNACSDRMTFGQKHVKGTCSLWKVKRHVTKLNLICLPRNASVKQDPSFHLWKQPRPFSFSQAGEQLITKTSSARLEQANRRDSLRLPKYFKNTVRACRVSYWRHDFYVFVSFEQRFKIARKKTRLPVAGNSLLKHYFIVVTRPVSVTQ